MENRLVLWVLWNVFNTLMLLTRGADATVSFQHPPTTAATPLPGEQSADYTNMGHDTVMPDQTRQLPKQTEAATTADFTGPTTADFTGPMTADFTGPMLHATVTESIPEKNVSEPRTRHDLAPCVHEADIQQITIEDTDGMLHYRGTNDSNLTACDVILQVPDDNIVYLRTDTCSFLFFGVFEYINITDRRVTTREMMCNSNLSNALVYSSTNRITINMWFFPHNAWKAQLSLHFSAVHKSEKLSLELVFLSPSNGYIQTPGWDTLTKYPPYMRSCVSLTLPSDHVVLLSFLGLYLGYGDSVLASAGRCVETYGKKSSLFKRHGSLFSGRGDLHEPIMFPESKRGARNNQGLTLSVLFSSDDMTEGHGFKLKFSFHPEHLKPHKVPVSPTSDESRWNCSVSVWPDLFLHFSCNLVSQCVESEDEVSCPYTTGNCGLNRVDVGGRCYMYLPEKYRTWLEGQSECLQHGALLISLETPQEWSDVNHLLELADITFTLIGLRMLRATGEASSHNSMYTNTWRWESDSVAYYFHTVENEQKHGEGLYFCAVVKERVSSKSLRLSYPMIIDRCDRVHATSMLCEFTPESSGHISRPVTLPVPGNTSHSRVTLVTCPLQHFTHETFACDLASTCRDIDSTGGWYNNVCKTSLESTHPYFYCGESGEFVPYSLVCDFRADCTGGSDEECVHLACTGNRINCGQGQCVDRKKKCDGHQDCTTNLDEILCSYPTIDMTNIKAPAVINFDKPGGFTVTPFPDNATQCPDTHFQCHNDGYCLPVYVRCNGVNDCPDHEDELWCNGYRCPGFYRCRGSDRTICVHVHHLCDGLPHCPQHDDELMCDLTCPEPCTCSGLAFTCTHTFQVSSFPQMRFLEARGSGLQQDDVTTSTMLIHLGVQACHWNTLTEFALPNIHSLDLSDNLLKHINLSQFAGMFHIRQLSLAHNPLSRSILDVQRKYLLPTLLLVNLSQVNMDSLNMDLLSTGIPKLQVLDVSQTGIKELQGQSVFTALRVLNMVGCPIADFTPDFMKSMNNLMQVFVDNFKLCCLAVLPDNFRGECFAPSDEISSCDDLLKSSVYRSALAVTAALAVLGNLCSFIYRSCLSAQRTKTGFAVFVLHLCISDLFMGVYLAIIGVADQVFAGIYIWNEATWKKSGVCSVAGFVSFLSSEVSAFLICIITLDRFLVLHFPFSQIRFGATSAHVACVVIWVVGLILATVPLLPVTSHWEFYHQTGICIPLPVTRADFAGHGYSFSVMIVCNLVLFILIAVGQSLIYWSVRSNAMSEKGMPTTSKNSDSVKSKDAIIARRLLTVAMSDFLCWFPIGLCGMLAAIGVVIPGEVNVAMAILVLPLNSALNPFLYTLNIILEKRQKARELFQRFLHAHLKQGAMGVP